MYVCEEEQAIRLPEEEELAPRSDVIGIVTGWTLTGSIPGRSKVFSSSPERLERFWVPSSLLFLPLPPLVRWLWGEGVNLTTPVHLLGGALYIYIYIELLVKQEI
jgi:hypothetical protein